MRPPICSPTRWESIGTLVRKAVRAGDMPFADARAMLRVIGPALLDGSLDGVTAVQGVDENTFIEILAAAFCARGQLPPARFGQNPYGVLPMTGIAELITTNPEPKTSEVHAFLARYANIVRELLPPFATQAVPVLQPNDTSAAAKLEELLKTNRVSTRLVVADEKDPNTAPSAAPMCSVSARGSARNLPARLEHQGSQCIVRSDRERYAPRCSIAWRDCR